MKKIFLHFEIQYILIDLNWIFLIKPSELKTSILVESYDEKTSENYRKGYVHSFQTIQDIEPTF